MPQFNHMTELSIFVTHLNCDEPQKSWSYLKKYTYSTVLYLMVSSTKASFLFLLDKGTQMTLFRIYWSKDLFLSSFWKNRPVYPFWSLSNECACRCVLCGRVIWSALIKSIRGQMRCQFFVVLSFIDNMVLWINVLCWYPDIQDESNTNSEVKYSNFGSVLVPEIRKDQWSVCKNYLQVSGARHFPFWSHNWLWLPLRVSSGGL